MENPPTLFVGSCSPIYPYKLCRGNMSSLRDSGAAEARKG